MLHYKNLILIGTSHIAIESVQTVQKTIMNEKPTLIAIELDKERLQGLLMKEKQNISIRSISTIGIKGYAFARLGHYAEQKLGSIVGVTPGSDMLKAVELARDQKIQLALIDQPINTTLKRLSRRLTWTEKFRFAKDFIFSIFKKQKIPFDLRKVPDQTLIKTMINDVQKKYPNVYYTLIEERNHYMARKLYHLMHHHEKIVAIIGAGHEDDILAIIKILERSA